MSLLEVRDLHVAVEGTEILRGVDLEVDTGRTHAIMGPNGSGKSTLSAALAGHPAYEVTGGSVTLDGEDLLSMSVDERARAGLFLAMQYPVEVPGRHRGDVPAPGGHGDPGAGAAAADVGQGGPRGADAPGHGLAPGTSAGSTRASAAGRRSASRCCSWSC